MNISDYLIRALVNTIEVQKSDNDDMIDVMLCKRVSKFKMSDSKAGPWACQKPPKFGPNYFSLTTGLIILKFV